MGCEHGAGQETSEKKHVADREACQAEAEDAGVEWYSFRQNANTKGDHKGKHKCTHSKSCNSVARNTENKWQRFSFKAQKPAKADKTNTDRRRRRRRKAEKADKTNTDRRMR